MLTNALELVAALLVSVGAGLTFGAGPALIVAGVCVGLIAFALGRDEGEATP